MAMITNDWLPAVREEFAKPYYRQLYQFVKEEYSRTVVYPPAEDIFNALHFTPLSEVKVLILGQDPYHNEHQAHGLSFSVLPDQKEIQAHHENMAFAVEVGEIRIQEENGNWIYGVTGTGFAQIMNNRATVIVDTCESPEDIDVRRAKEAKERAEEQLRQKQSIQEYYRSKASLARAMERLKASSHDRPIGY